MSLAASDKSIHLTVITPARAVLDARVSALVAPAFDGELGVLPGHAPMLAMLGTGELRATTPDGKTRRLAVRGGFLQVGHDKVTVLTPESLASEDIKPDTLKGEAEKLDAEKPTKPDEREAQEQRRARVKVRRKVSGS